MTNSCAVCGEPDDEYDCGDGFDADDEMENALSECGQTPEGGCMLAGTEYCDFDCPYRDIDLFSDDEPE